MGPCHQFKENIMELLDNELDIFQKKNLEKHLKECLRCSSFLSRVRLLKSYLKKLPSIKASENFQILLRERIRRETVGREKIAVTRASIVKRWAPAFGIAFFLIMIAVWILNFGIPFSHSPEGKLVTNPTIKSSNVETFNGKVQYVIDDFPTNASLSKSNSTDQRDSSLIGSDSLLQNNSFEEIKAHLTPVSF